MVETIMMSDGCFYADDVRLSGYLQTMGIRRRQCVIIHDTYNGYHAGSVHMKKNAVLVVMH
jgi:hypothetical protein